MTDINRRFLFAASAAGAVMASAAARAQTAPANTPAPGGTDIAALPQPAARQGKTLSVDGAKIFYTVQGSGSPLVLIHGYPLSGALFGRVAAQLAQNHQVIIPDLRGYGLSTAPAETTTVDPYVSDVLALMDALKVQKATIAGMSMGGAVTLGLFKKAPERFSGLIMIDTTYKKASPAEAGEWRGAETMINGGMTKDLIQMLLPQMLTGETRMNDKAQVAYLTAICNQASKTALLSGAAALAGRPDGTALLPTIKVPALVLVGEDDPLYGFESAQLMQAQIPGAQLHIVPGAAHAAIFEKPDDAGGAITGFLANSVKS